MIKGNLKRVESKHIKRNYVRYANVLLNSIKADVFSIGEYKDVDCFEDLSNNSIMIKYGSLDVVIEKVGDFEDGFIKLNSIKYKKNFSRDEIIKKNCSAEFTCRDSLVNVVGVDTLYQDDTCKYIYPFKEVFMVKDDKLVSVRENKKYSK